MEKKQQNVSKYAVTKDPYYRKWNFPDFYGKYHLNQFKEKNAPVPGSQVKEEQIHLEKKKSIQAKVDDDIQRASKLQQKIIEVKDASAVFRTRIYLDTILGEPINDALSVIDDREQLMNKKPLIVNSPAEILEFQRNVEANKFHFIGYAVTCGFKSLDYQSSTGDTFLHMAVRRGHLESVEELLKFKAYPELRNSLGNCPVHDSWCFWKYHANRTKEEREEQERKTCEILLTIFKYGGYVDAQDQNGYAPLHIACHRGPMRAVLIILGFQANHLVRTRSGDMAIDIARRKKNVELVRLLSIWHQVKHALVHVDFVVIWRKFISDYEAVISNQKSAESIIFELDMEANNNKLERAAVKALPVDDPFLHQSFMESKEDRAVPKPWEKDWHAFVKESINKGIVSMHDRLNPPKKKRGYAIPGKDDPNALSDTSPNILNVIERPSSSTNLDVVGGFTVTNVDSTLSFWQATNAPSHLPERVARIRYPPLEEGQHVTKKQIQDKLRKQRAEEAQRRNGASLDNSLQDGNDNSNDNSNDNNNNDNSNPKSDSNHDESVSCESSTPMGEDSCTTVSEGAVVAVTSQENQNLLASLEDLAIQTHYGTNKASATDYRRPRSQVQSRRYQAAEAIAQDGTFLQYTRRPCTSSALMLSMRHPEAPLEGTEEEGDLYRHLTSQGKEYDIVKKNRKISLMHRALGEKYVVSRNSIGAYQEAVEVGRPSARDQLFHRLVLSKPSSSLLSEINAQAGKPSLLSRPGTAAAATTSMEISSTADRNSEAEEDSRSMGSSLDEPDNHSSQNAMIPSENASNALALPSVNNSGKNNNSLAGAPKVGAAVIETLRRNTVDLVHGRRMRYVSGDVLPPLHQETVIESLTRKHNDFLRSQHLAAQGLDSQDKIDAAQRMLEASILEEIGGEEEEEGSLSSKKSVSSVGRIDTNGEIVDPYMSKEDAVHAHARAHHKRKFFLQKQVVRYGRGRLSSTHNLTGTLPEPWSAVTGRQTTRNGDRTA